MLWKAKESSKPIYVWKDDQWYNESDKRIYYADIDKRLWYNDDRIIDFDKKTKVIHAVEK